MPRIRTIKPEFWDDEKIALLGRDARLVYIAMWNFSDDYGVVKGASIWLKSKIFPYDTIQTKQFDGWLLELQSHGFIVLFQVKSENYYHLPNFCRHQVINKPSQTRNPQYPIKTEIKDVTPPEEKPKDSGSTPVVLPPGVGVGGERKLLYTAGAHEFDSVVVFLDKVFPITAQQLLLKHGMQTYQKVLKEFSDQNVEHAWEDEEDLRSHVQNFFNAFLRAQSNKSTKPKSNGQHNEPTTPIYQKPAKYRDN